jgi:uncharacterized protein YndB with AHSA1/START domain
MTDAATELTIVRVINAPREQVFRAWTDPEILAKWWGPSGVSNPVCKLDVRPGGAIEIVMLAGEELGDLKGAEWPMSGIYQEVMAPSKLVYTSSAIVGGVPILDCLNTVTFDVVDGKTRLTLRVVVTRTTTAADGPLAGMQIGWSQSMDKLIASFQDIR